MAIAVASIMQESNDFSPIKTKYEDFSLEFGERARNKYLGSLTEMGGFLDGLGRVGRRIEPICTGWAVTAGRVRKSDFNRILHEFKKRLAAIRKPDAVLLALHGGQTAESDDDVAGRVICETRRIVGPSTPIVVTLDLHANVTRRMVENANVLFGYRTYPHIDLYETGLRGADLTHKILNGTLVPATVFRKLPLVVPAENMQTTSGPFGRLWAMANKFEGTKNMEAISLFGVQPWLDAAEMGASVVCLANGNRTAAVSYADRLANAFWTARREFDVKLVPVARALREALKQQGGPVILSEPSDSTGSGSPGDSTGVLRPLIDVCRHEPAAIFLVDRPAVAQAIRSGVGSTITMRVGGTIDRKHSRPVRITGRVRLLSDGRWTPKALGYSTGVEVGMGRTAVVEVGKVRILIAEQPALTVDPELFQSHGIDPERMKIVVVKSPNGFRAAYGPIAKKMILVDTPGISTPKLRQLPYNRVPRPIYPLDPRTKFEASSAEDNPWG